ncbi:unnamed protein product [Parascedosporium putredinis]|uniref:Uncharacterized protein n=1 Tax=Parascedosporium putredinis TaxID=1442378 RepID=A0A9P1GVY1_9PEZI|nr:unnamed protein product [Parascedosporium putredinis]CAI7988036.1 unnamed protein product [Parascedosporium putredinis]
MASEVDKVLAALEELQSTPLSIITLSELIPKGGQNADDPRTRSSDASSSSLTEATTPASLEDDLEHYRELFSKLRFSYENLALEKENLRAKKALKDMKIEMTEMVAELERKGKDLSKKYEIVSAQTIQLRELPGKIDELEAKIAELGALRTPGQDPNLSLPLSRTLELVEERKAEMSQLDRELEQLRAQLPRKIRNWSVSKPRGQEEERERFGGVEDDLEERARWWRASEAILRQALDIQEKE